MSKLTFQQRGNQNTRIPVGQRRATGGKALEDNRAAFAAKQLKQDQTAQLTKEEDELLKGKSGTKQLAKKDEEEIGQAKFSDRGPPVQREQQPAKPNNTGLPDKLKNGIEALSGMSMDNVKVHYNSAKPQQLNALAYAQGTDIHVGPGQEKHLPHEAWHVVQQAQGRVRPTMQMKGGVSVNNDKGLEREADVMGAKAVGITQQKSIKSVPSNILDIHENDAADATQRQVEASTNTYPSFGTEGLGDKMIPINIQFVPTSQFAQATLQKQSGEIVQCMVSFADIKNYIYGVWKASSWKGVVDSTSLLVKTITSLVKASPGAKIAALIPILISEGMALSEALRKYYALEEQDSNYRRKLEEYQNELIKYSVLTLTTVAKIVSEYYGGSLVVNVIQPIIDKVVSNIKNLKYVHQIGIANASAHHGYRRVDTDEIPNLV